LLALGGQPIARGLGKRLALVDMMIVNAHDVEIGCVGTRGKPKG
jgi:hypothetical protein